tara:strand:+ start:100 stop:726 length:627 start_codon:yes stop_codon:yes gene_type:complete
MTGIVEYQDFLDEKLIELTNTLDTPVESFFDHPQGVFNGAETSRHQWFDQSSRLGQELVSRLEQLDYFKGNKVDGMQVTDMLKPYDVHSDYIVTHKQVPISDPKKSIPTYTTIIPLVLGDNKTVVFNEKANYNNFQDYKKQNASGHGVPKELWDQLCGHCHNEDRVYLTVKQVIEWKKGDLFAFDRLFFHSSANFEEPKRAIVVWSSR